MLCCLLLNTFQNFLFSNLFLAFFWVAVFVVFFFGDFNCISSVCFYLFRIAHTNVYASNTTIASVCVLTTITKKHTTYFSLVFLLLLLSFDTQVRQAHGWLSFYTLMDAHVYSTQMYIVQYYIYSQVNGLFFFWQCKCHAKRKSVFFFSSCFIAPVCVHNICVTPACC